MIHVNFFSRAKQEVVEDDALLKAGGMVVGKDLLGLRHWIGET